MKIYTAQKPCKFGGKEYCIGDEVPEKLIDPTRVKVLIKFGLLAVSEHAEETADTPTQTDDEGELTKGQSTNETKQSEEGDKEPESAQETADTPKVTGKKGAKK